MGNCLKKTGKDQETETDPEEDGDKENEEPISKPDTEEVPETVWASTPIQTLNQQEDTTAASAAGLSPSNVGALLNAFVQKSNTQAGGNYPASSEAKPTQRAVSRFRVVERCANTPPVSLGRFQSARGYKSTACPVAINKYGVGPGYNYSTGWGTPAPNCQDPCPTAKTCPSTNQCQSINAYINCYNSCKSTVNNAIVPTQNIDVCRSPSVGVTCNDSSSAAECLRLGGGRPTRAIGVTSTIVTGDSDSNSNQSKHNDECLSAWTAPCASTTNRTPVIVHREGLLVGIVTVFTNAVVCRRSTLSTYPSPKILNIHLICQQLSTCAWTGHL